MADPALPPDFSDFLRLQNAAVLELGREMIEAHASVA
jgi:hypothetical protein